VSAEHDAVELEAKIGRIEEAVKTINKHHNLGDAVYDVRSHAAESMPDGDGSTWDHPDVKAYSDAVSALQKELPEAFK
jgi:hypothetical protein